MWSSNSSPFAEAKASKPLILDGAIGSMLQKKGIPSLPSIWTTKVLLDAPNVLLDLHREYIQAGSDIITTHTFRTNPAALDDTPFSSDNLVSTAVAIAKEASADSKTIIAGSNPPAEDCYQNIRTLSQNKLEYNHAKHIDLLYSNGVDFILNETQSHYDEIKIILQRCFKDAVPAVISLYITPEYKILSGEKFGEILPLLQDYAPVAISFNCISADVFNAFLEQEIYHAPSAGYFGIVSPPEKIKVSVMLKKYFNWGFYLNCGKGNKTESKISDSIEPSRFADSLEKPISFSPSFIGACCGSTPDHIYQLSNIING
jgi:homocysteine S-methyltransferase